MINGDLSPKKTFLVLLKVTQFKKNNKKSVGQRKFKLEGSVEISFGGLFSFFFFQGRWGMGGDVYRYYDEWYSNNIDKVDFHYLPFNGFTRFCGILSRRAARTS